MSTCQAASGGCASVFDGAGLPLLLGTKSCAVTLPPVIASIAGMCFQSGILTP